MATLDHETLLGIVRNRPLLAVALLRAAAFVGEDEPADGEAIVLRFPWTRLASAEEPALAARYREIIAAARRTRANLGESMFGEIIAFLNARIEEGLHHTDLIARKGVRDWRAERDLWAKRARVAFLESILLDDFYLAVEEHSQAEHLLKLEAAAYNWHDDYQDDWHV
ncbi:hypothetical protein [Microbispora amethystogenes]|uniref:Uncharacterized protein n=1 Tax=Microbispora amethystogenes TaxID=1427754 RepID=A0ABQ4FF23_9ACTN|nr:hypothetical protein [Microbispora amethystogenes]GIH33390.1 hypothetical protein Mam01_35540 [Microbispora amethystogenes]